MYNIGQEAAFGTLKAYNRSLPQSGILRLMTSIIFISFMAINLLLSIRFCEN